MPDLTVTRRNILLIHLNHIRARKRCQGIILEEYFQAVLLYLEGL
jgi:hypothetical protein